MTTTTEKRHPLETALTASRASEATCFAVKAASKRPQSRKDYKAIAAALLTTKAKNETIEAIAYSCHATNPSFDFGRFYAAAGYRA